MGAFIDYFRKNPWQRRAVTVLLAICLGSGAALIALPLVQDWTILRDLRSGDANVRNQTMLDAAQRAANSGRFLRLLIDQLDTPDDGYFVTLAKTLQMVRAFEPGHVGAAAVDRYRAISYLSNLRNSVDPNSAAVANAWTLHRMIRARRDNPHVRRVLQETAGLDFMEPRTAHLGELAAVLAGAIGHEDTLSKLLVLPADAMAPPRPGSPPPPPGFEDVRSRPAAAAACVVGIAEMQSLSGRVTALLAAPDWRVKAGACYALAKLDPDRHAGRIAQELLNARHEPLRDRLLTVAAMVDANATRNAVAETMHRALRRGGNPPAMAMTAAGALGMNDTPTANRIRGALREAINPQGTLTYSQLIAALAAARELKLDVFEPTAALCDVLWSPKYSRAMVHAARLLGETEPMEPATDQPPTNAAINRMARRVQLLKRAAHWVAVPRPTTRPASRPMDPVTTPLASAAAGVSLWLFAGEFTHDIEDDVRSTVRHEYSLPGDYVAWHLGRRGDRVDFQLGLSMLPPLQSRDPNATAVYNDNERSAGAMLLALAWRTPAQKAAALKRIGMRLEGGAYGPEQDFFVKGSYHCALLILGQRQWLDDVVELRKLGAFPQRRCITALLMAGHAPTLDWLLLDPSLSDADVELLVVDRGIGEVLQSVAPHLPRIDPAARGETLVWQLTLLRWTHAIVRRPPGAPRP
ncbi:MAG: hypothetical protein ACLFV7_05265 [Phycisphaerae bacterium]